jgi:hypothetical protein
LAGFIFDHSVEGEVGFSLFGRLGLDARDLVLVEAGLRSQVSASHPGELDVHTLHQRVVLGGVERGERDDATEHLGDRELHAGVHDAELVTVAL